MEQLFSREPVGEFDPCLVESLPIPAWGEMLESAYRCKVLLVGMAGVGKTMLSETIQGHSHAKTRRTWEHQVMRPQCVQLAVPLIDDQLAKLDLSDTRGADRVLDTLSRKDLAVFDVVVYMCDVRSLASLQALGPHMEYIQSRLTTDQFNSMQHILVATHGDYPPETWAVKPKDLVTLAETTALQLLDGHTIINTKDYKQVASAMIKAWEKVYELRQDGSTGESDRKVPAWMGSSRWAPPRASESAPALALGLEAATRAGQQQQEAKPSGCQCQQRMRAGQEAGNNKRRGGQVHVAREGWEADEEGEQGARGATRARGETPPRAWYNVVCPSM